MSYTQETIISDSGRYQARIVLDESPCEPDGDMMTPLIAIGGGRYAGEYATGADSAEHDGLPFDMASMLDEALGRYDEDHALTIISRLMSVCGVPGRIEAVERTSADYYAYITLPMVRNYWGNTQALEDIKLDAGEFGHFLNGDVWGIVVEEVGTRHVVEVNADDEELDAYSEEIFSEVESCWGFYADPYGTDWEYVLETARAMMPDETTQTAA